MDPETFREICLEGNGMKALDTVTERRRFSAQFRELSETKLRAAEHLLDTDAEQMVVGHVYGAMEAKANELLAWHGYRSKNHLCTQVGLSRLLDREDLARSLSRVYDDRQTFEYTADPGTMTSADSYVALLETARAYVAKVEMALEDVRP